MKKVLFFLFLAWNCLPAVGQTTMADTLSRVTNNFFVIENTASAYFTKKYAANNGLPTYKTKYFNTDSGRVAFEKIDGEWAKYNRWAWYWRDRILPDGSFPDVDSIFKLHSYVPHPHKRGAVPSWNCINQTSCTGGYNGMGRTKCIVFHPTDPNIFYVGAPIGGLWKTTDGGLSYTQLTDSLPYVAAGTAVIDHQNPDILYISVSDNGGWWNYSLGIYKSTDAGRSWNPTGLKWTFGDQVAVYTMVISPTNPSHLLVAASNGLWSSTNGGTSWTRSRTGAHNDIKFRPDDGQTVYATTDDYYGSSEIYRSTNAGASWTKMSSFGLKNNTIRLAVTKANPDMLVAQNTSDKSLYVSKDKGASYTFKSNVDETAIVGVSPTNENILYSGYVSIFKSANGGTSWTKMTEWYGGTRLPEVHADQQFVAYNPINNYVYFCNDGGIYRYNEGSNSWKELSNGLVITQYYRIANAQNDPMMLIGGTQDNGGRMRNTNGSWSATNGGDAMEVAVDPADYRISYSTYCNGQLFRTTNNWTSNTDISANIPGKPQGEWVTPYVLDPSNSKVIVAGYDEIYRSTDRGTSWTKISSLGAGLIQCVAVAPTNSAIIYATRENSIFVSTNTGSSWTRFTGPNTSDRITSISVDPTNPSRVLITYSGYSQGKRVYRSTDGGASFKNISGTLPTVPANILMFENGSDGRMYVGTDAGVYTRNNSTADWVRYGAGLPNTSVLDLDIQYASKKLRAGTHGRGVWEIDLYGVKINELPVVSITAPASGYQNDNEPLVVSATASDPDGTIAKVEFFLNGISVGTTTKAPYTIELTAFMAGDGIVLARAYDDANAMGESSPVAVSLPCPLGYVARGEIIGTAGSWNNTGNDMTKVFDGDTETSFDAPDAVGAWVGMDLQSAQRVTGIRLFPRASYTERMNGAVIQLSNKPDFTDAKSIFTLPTVSQTTWYCIALCDTAHYRYVRYLSADNSHCNVSECEIITAPVIQKISLVKGWNLISTNVQPDTTGAGRDAVNRVSAIFANLDVKEIKTMDAFWRAGQPDTFNSLKTITPGEGYLVNMNEADTLTVTGTPISYSNFQINQFSNWCLIGCPYPAATPIAGILGSNFLMLKNFEGINIPGNTNNSILHIEPGKGYFIKK